MLLDCKSLFTKEQKTGTILVVADVTKTTSATCCLHRDRVQAKMSLGGGGNSEKYVILNALAHQVALVVLVHQPLLK